MQACSRITVTNLGPGFGSCWGFGEGSGGSVPRRKGKVYRADRLLGIDLHYICTMTAHHRFNVLLIFESTILEPRVSPNGFMEMVVGSWLHETRHLVAGFSGCRDVRYRDDVIKGRGLVGVYRVSHFHGQVFQSYFYRFPCRGLWS